MRENLVSICNRIIEYSFYAIFLLVPLTFTSTTSELFEFNKMWLTYGITLVIAASWVSKMILQKKFFIQKTPLDIPIALFLLSQIIATIISIDSHISFWGYYSRFNGGLLSMFTYIFLYYAFVSNFFLNPPQSEQNEPPKTISEKGYRILVTKHALFLSIGTGILAGILVALWGIPSHFGYDPTCYVFRGTFDVSCWTEAFQPKIRMFSTLGQPNWLAAYMAILIPLSLAMSILYWEKQFGQKTKSIINVSLLFCITFLFYVALLYANSQSGFLGITAALGVFVLLYILVGYHRESLRKRIIIAGSTILILGGITFVLGQPIAQLDQFTLPGLQKMFQSQQQAKNTPAANQATAGGTALEGGGGGGGTSSGEIRKNVWTGAVDIWKANPLFGTGVETFAFAYYNSRPAAHNMTSEWDYLYNKAHNEYLNYLATTGAFGLLTYLIMIATTLFLAVKALRNHAHLSRLHVLLIIGLVSGYISILVSNFFGFSVVILNIYLFLIPAFIFLLANQIIPGKSLFSLLTKSSEVSPVKQSTNVTSLQWVGILVIWGLALSQMWTLINYWYADQAFAMAQNYNRIGQYEQGFQKIREAIALRNNEPIFIEELATSDALIAQALAGQQQEEAKKQSEQLANEAVQTITQLTTAYPHNINFLKSQVRVYYTLSQTNPAYLQQALETMKRLQKLAPTDAKISYNLGVLYGQTGQTEKGIETLETTMKLKPDYRDVYFALGLFYHDLATNENGAVTNSAMQEKAVAQMQYILTHFSNKDKAVLDTLKSWGEN